jgi:hypothetical protein
MSILIFNSSNAEPIVMMVLGPIVFGLGCLVLRHTQGKQVHPWLKAWWAPKDQEVRNFVDRAMGLIVGGGAILWGIGVFIAGAIGVAK